MPEPINQVNFLRWYEPVAGAIPTADIADSGKCLEVYTADLRADSDCKVIAEYSSEQYALPMVYGDQVSFVINANKDFGAANSLTLWLLKNDALTPVASPAIAYITEGGNKYLTGQFTVPCSAEDRQNIILMRTASGINEIVAVSNPVRIINFQSGQHPTVLADFRHSVSQFGFPYTTGTTFRNRFRIDALLTIPRHTESISTYIDRNEVTRFVGKGKINRVQDFKTDHLDAATHEAITAMFMHNDLKLNGKAFLKIDSYESELENDVYPLYQASTRLKDLSFSQLQNNC